MRVRGQIGDDLLRRDAHPHGATDGLARQLSRHHVRVAGAEPAEEREDGDLQGRGGVGVDAVVGLDHDEAAVVVRRGRAGERGCAKTGCVRRERRGETGRVEEAGSGRVAAGLVDDAVVAQVLEHLELRLRQVGFRVGEPELEGAEHEEEGEDVDVVHVEL